MIIEFSIKIAIFVWVIGTIICYLIPKFRNKTVLVSIFLLYILAVIHITFFPIMTMPKWELSECIKQSVSYIPFRDILDELDPRSFVKQILGNVIMFLPLAFFLCLFRESKFKYESRKVILQGMGVSVIIEILQLVENIITSFPQRVTSIDDVILNTLGVAIGCAIIKFGLYIKKRSEN